MKNNKKKKSIHPQKLQQYIATPIRRFSLAECDVNIEKSENSSSFTTGCDTSRISFLIATLLCLSSVLAKLALHFGSRCSRKLGVARLQHFVVWLSHDEPEFVCVCCSRPCFQ